MLTSRLKSPLLVLLAHPDDEFAVFPWIRGAIQHGYEVHAIWLTDGGWGGQDKVRRRLESISVLSLLGLPHGNMHFFGEQWSVPDGRLHLSLDKVIPHFLEQFEGLGSSGSLLLPAWEGGHQDHDATHLAGIHLARNCGSEPSQYSLYNGEGLPGPCFKVLSPLAQNGPIERIATTLFERFGYAKLCMRYKSQWKSFIGLLPAYLWRMCRSDAFAIQAVDPLRTAHRPHAGSLLYERRGGPLWEDFASATRPYRT